MLTRAQVVQRLLDTVPDPVYLEVGISEGETFNQLQAGRKVGIDPKFLFDESSYAVPGKAEFHPVASDDYFAALPATATFDVVFLDGLHTFEQTLRDLIASLGVLKRGGVIILDDVLPNSLDASVPDVAQVFALREAAKGTGLWPHDGSWMGDVFKVLFFIETFMPQLSFATVADTHGMTVAWRQPRPVKAARTVEQIARMDYRDTILHRRSYRFRTLDEIVSMVGASRLRQ